jgi:hypothetical protein
MEAEASNAMAEIYALYSCRNGLVRYVGETTYSLETRFGKHRREAWLLNTPLDRWLMGEWKSGFEAKIVRLQWCSDEDRFDLETKWIWKFPNLLNRRKYPDWRRYGNIRPPKIPEITAYMREHRFNIDGRRGIHYQVSMDRFFVLIFTGSGLELLGGDEEVGGGNAIWFSDLAAAENARDRYYTYKPHLPRLPDFTNALF